MSICELSEEPSILDVVVAALHRELTMLGLVLTDHLAQLSITFLIVCFFDLILFKALFLAQIEFGHAALFFA